MAYYQDRLHPGRSSDYVSQGPVGNAVDVRLNSGEVMRIEIANLPEADMLVTLLKNNRVKLGVWVNLALLYYRRKQYEDFESILDINNYRIADKDYVSKEKDEMRYYDMLAAFYVEQGIKEKDPEKKRQHFVNATINYTQADKIIMYDQNHLLGRAYFCLLEGSKVDQAEIQLKFVLNDEQRGGLAPPTDDALMIPALMGRAAIMYMKKDYKAALQIYKKCLSTSPSAPAGVRIGIGYCLAKLGKPEKAKIAFTRALQLEPDNVDAKASLAVLQMTSSTDGSEMLQGIQSLAAVYRDAKDHPLVLNHLANHFFIKSQLHETQDKESLLVKAKRLLDHAITVTKNDQMIAETNFHLARFFHAQNKIHDAHRHYYLASQQANPKFKLPSYGYGQTNILLHEYEKAIDEFEKVLKVYPENTDVLKVLGALYAKTSQNAGIDKKLVEDRRNKAKEYLDKAARHNPEDFEVLVDLAVHLQSFDQISSLAVYNSIVDKLNANNAVVPAELLNNIATLYYMTKNYSKARETYEECRELLVQQDLTDARTKASLISVTFNLGRTLEKLRRFGDAERIYKGILKKRPSYMDAMFRLGVMQYLKGDNAAAINHFKEVISADPKSFDSYLMWGQILLDQGQLGAAQKKFEEILKTSTSEPDALALVSMGNVWLKMLMDMNRNREKDNTNRERALQFFYKCLRLYPKNVYALHGAGIVFAQKGELNTAIEFFSQVRERISDYPDVWINTAHVNLDLGQHQNAIQLYQTGVRRFNQRSNTDVFTNIAQGFFKLGKFDQALDYLDRCILLDKTNLIHKFNYAITTLAYSKAIVENSNSSEDKVIMALKRLRKAEASLKKISGLSANEVQKYRYISRTTCGEIAKKCEDLLQQSQKFIESARRKDAEEIQRNLQSMEEAKKVRDAQRKLVRHKAEEEQNRLEQLKFQRLYYVEKTKDALKRVEVEDEPRRGGGGGGRKRKRPKDENDFVDDSDVERNPDEPPMDKKERKKKQQMARKASKKKDEAFINDGSSDDGKKKRRKRKEQEVEEEDQRKFKGKIKSKAFVESSSSSDSDAEKPAKEEEVPTIRHLPGASSDEDSDAPKRNAFDSDSDDEPAPPLKESPKKRVVDSDDSDDSPPPAKSSDEDSD